ncbi:MAG TPA: DUF1508 domain-containing protein [Frankiaceae bacterium]|nr:DUF1508 domain-containing protein [Frankiaceae bacterium]
MAKFEIVKDRRGEYRWHLDANNGKIIADSGEGYATKSNCARAVATVIREICDATIVDKTGEK